MEALTGLLSIRVSGDNLLVLQNVTALAGLIDFHEVLINDAAGADIEVTHLGVAHLALRQTDVLTASHELRVGAGSVEQVEIRCGCVVDNVTAVVFAESPSVEDHQQSFLCHNDIALMFVFVVINHALLALAKLPHFR